MSRNKFTTQTQELLGQTLMGLDVRAMLNEVGEFILITETSIQQLKVWELHRNGAKFERISPSTSDDIPFEDLTVADIEYKFDFGLTQRCRYSALIGLITTIEWCLISLSKRTTFKTPKKPQKMSETIHILKTLSNRINLDLSDKIVFIDGLIQIRNCIVHSAGLITSYRYEAELRELLKSSHGIRISTDCLLGDAIEIEPGFLETTVNDLKSWLSSIETEGMRRGLLC